MPFQSSFFRARKFLTEWCGKQAERNVPRRQVEDRQPSSGWTATNSAPTWQRSIICPGGLGVDWEFGHSFRRTLRIMRSHSPLRAGCCLVTVPWLAGIGLQSPLEAGNAFSESLRDWECLFKVLFLGHGNATLSDHAGNKLNETCPGGRWRRDNRHLGEQPPTVLPPLWGWECLLQEPAVTDSARPSTSGVKVLPLYTGLEPSTRHDRSEAVQARLKRVPAKRPWVL